MFSLIAKMSTLLRKNSHPSSGKSLSTGEVKSQWKDTGKVFYLEQTFKLVYQSNCGEVTLENLSFERLSAVLEQLKSMDEQSPMSRATIANTDSAFQLSLCAVTWQQNEDNLRIKAIPEAAILRSKTPDFNNAQAIFKHEFLLEHDDILTPTVNHQKAGVFIYNQISIGQFTEQIRVANQSIENALKRRVSVKAENYSTPFTSNEERVINAVLTDQNKR